MKISLRQLRTIIQEELEKSLKDETPVITKADIEQASSELAEDPKALEALKDLQNFLFHSPSMDEVIDPTKLQLFTRNPNAPLPNEEGPYSLKARREEDKFHERLKQFFAAGMIPGVGLYGILMGLITGSEAEVQGGEQILIGGIAALGALKFAHIVSDLIEKAEEKKRFDYVPPIKKQSGRSIVNVDYRHPSKREKSNEPK